MRRFPAEIQFRYPWRIYQQRVLDELSGHLMDGHLHIVAPPGSGKTVLGLEVARRLDQPTLILAPTLAIRNQWIQRFCELFLALAKPPDWISRSLAHPGFITVTTYQALHAACQGDNSPAVDDESEIAETAAETTAGQRPPRANRQRRTDALTVFNRLRDTGVRTLVLDEAHHLKNAWWESLNLLKRTLQPTIIGLTATPPYDVTPAEWRRYIDMNGPVDAEITIPELVRAGDLCPHQDCVYLTYPTAAEARAIISHHQNLRNLLDDMVRDPDLIQAIEGHPVWQAPTEHLEWIYTNFAYYAAMLVYLHGAGRPITRLHLDVVGQEDAAIPALNGVFMENLLTFYLYKDPDRFHSCAEHQRKMLGKLTRAGAVERRVISLDPNRRTASLLSTSISKLGGIGQIVAFEYANLGHQLRMVILTDFVRREYMPDTPVHDMVLAKIGVLSIFEHLRRAHPGDIRLGVLSGSVVILPRTALDPFLAKAVRLGIGNIDYRPLPYDPDYVLIQLAGRLSDDIVRIYTRIFQDGHVEVLVGTKALLGEGWDAPAINSLVMASFVGSHVLSNQMRGRAIRTDPHVPHKTANIWHLACISPVSANGGEDILILRRRFKSFAGLSCGAEARIENGFDRLGLPAQFQTDQQIHTANQTMLGLAADRDGLRERWLRALNAGTEMIERIRFPFSTPRGLRMLKRLYYTKTIRNMLMTLIFGMFAFAVRGLEMVARGLREIRDPREIILVATVLALAGTAFFARRTWRLLRIIIRFRDISKDILAIGNVLLKALIRAGAIETAASRLKVRADVDAFGGILCHLEGGTTLDKSTFLKALREIISVFDNPRYLIVRKSESLLFVPQRDYHAVPEIIGRNKRMAEAFRDDWRRMVGACELVYTRTIEGRRLLLRARGLSLATQLEDEVEQVTVWQT